VGLSAKITTLYIGGVAQIPVVPPHLPQRRVGKKVIQFDVKVLPSVAVNKRKGLLSWRIAAPSISSMASSPSRENMMANKVVLTENICWIWAKASGFPIIA
jgi:hypothetical protein